jgi:Tol biopolymer transport system component
VVWGRPDTWVKPSLRRRITAYWASKSDDAQERRLTWFGRAGQSLEVIAASGAYRSFRLLPDEKRLAAEVKELHTGAPGIWVIDLARGISSRFAFDPPRADGWPVWSLTGDWIAFYSDKTAPANLYRKVTSGDGEERLTEKNRVQHPNDWSSDGRYLLYQEQDPDTRWDLWVVPLSPVGKPTPFLRSPFNETQGQFSGDGRLVAYVSDETNRNEIHVRSFPDSTQRWQVSTNGGPGPAGGAAARSFSM